MEDATANITSFSQLGLLPELLRAVAEEGYTQPTPIQGQAIPAVLARRDIMGSAQTGTGKTASFALPILQILFPHANTSPSPARHTTRALVLTPTRELAVQVEESFRAYGRHVPLRTAVIYGGVDMDPQIRQLHAGVEVIVATPGRLLDHVRNKTAMLARVEVLVLDEADRMLDMGFLPDIKRILAQLPAKRQNLLFSATYSEDIRKLADELLNHPVMIAVAPRNTAAETVTHRAYLVDEARKRELLAHLILERDLHQVLVFTRTRLGANRLARNLERDGINATAIHSNRTQAEREKALADFKSGAVRILVATDVASRGLDIEELPIVVNFELPHSPEDYIHRIGRTGRAGSTGEAISLVDAEEDRFLAEIDKLLKKPIPRESLPGFGRGERGVRREHGERREHAERRDVHEHRERPRADIARRPRVERERRNESAPPRPPAPRIAPDGFDFSKPYEPAAAPSEPQRPDAPRTPARPRAALLGGFRPK